MKGPELALGQGSASKGMELLGRALHGMGMEMGYGGIG